MNREFILSVGIASWLYRTFIRQFNKRVLGRGLCMRLPTGSVFPIPRDSRVGSAVYITQADVDYGSEALLARLAAGDRGFVDVGANVGYYSAYMAPAVAFVYAFEPDERAFPSLNRLQNSIPRLTAIHAAVSDTDGEGRLSYGACSDVSALTKDSATGTPVRTCTLDSLLPFLPGHIGAIKIDTEGHELAVLAGAEALVLRDRPLILLETPVEGAIVEWAGKRGYAIGAACKGEPNVGPVFRWFTSPDAAHVKMVLLDPAEAAEAVNAAATELYGTPTAYRRALKQFQSRTLHRLQQRSA